MIPNLIKSRVNLLAIKYGNFYPYRRYMTKNKCIFIHVPKAAGSSILQALQGKDVHIQRDHCEWRAFRGANSNLFTSYFKFTFVRHPIDRIHSSYRYLMGGGNKMNNRELSTLLKNNYPNFNSFVQDYLCQDRIRTQVLFRPQYTFFCDEGYKSKVDFIGKYENIEEDFDFVRKKLKLKSGLDRVNVSEAKDQVVIDEVSKIKLCELYKKDFEILGY